MGSGCASTEEEVEELWLRMESMAIRLWREAGASMLGRNNDGLRGFRQGRLRSKKERKKERKQASERGSEDATRIANDLGFKNHTRKKESAGAAAPTAPDRPRSRLQQQSAQ